MDKIKKYLGHLLVLIAVLILLAPIVESRIIDKWENQKIIDEYLQETIKTKKKSSTIDVSKQEVKTIGILSIPKIDLEIPAYLGTTELALSKGCGAINTDGNIQGKIGEHPTLTSHNGLSSSGLFTNLHELELNDTFIFETKEKLLKYKVIDIVKVLPTDTEHLGKQSEKALMTLLTCTPININSHRLLVTGEIIEALEKNSTNKNKIKKIKDVKIEKKMSQYEQTSVSILIIVLFLYMGYLFFVFARKRKEEEDYIVTLEIKKDQDNKD